MVRFRLGSLVCAVFLFGGCESFEPGGMPRFRLGADDWLVVNVLGCGVVAPPLGMVHPSGVMLRHTLKYVDLCRCVYSE